MEYTDPLQPTPALTPDQQGLASNAGITAGQAGSPWTASTPVTMGSLTTPTPINLPPVPPTNTSAADATVASSVAAATPTGAPPTETQNKANTLTDQISVLLGQDTGRAQALSDAEKASGAVDLQKQLTDLNGQIGVKSAEYDKMFANLGGNGVVETSGVLAAQQAGLRLARAADIGLLTARAQATQGNLTLANETAAKAVDLKYSQIEDQLKVKQSQLALLKDTLDREYAQQDKAESRQYDEKIKALDRQYNEQQQKIAEEKAQAKENVNLALTAGITTKYVNKNGQFFDAATGQPFSDPAAFFKAAGVNSFEEAYKRGLITDFSVQKVADQEYVSQLRAKYNDAGINLNDTPEQAEEKLKKSAIFRKDNYIAPVGGSGNGSGTLAGTPILDKGTDAQVQAILNNRKAYGDGGWGDVYKAIQTKIGETAAKKYEGVVDNVFRLGTSVDAAFNNTKLSGGGGLSAEAQAVAANPDLLNSFTPTKKGEIITQLSKGGFDVSQFGKKILSGSQLDGYNQGLTALSSLDDLVTILKDNEQYIGPVSGVQSLNPYSEARKAQAKIDAVKQRVGKALEGGVLRKEDEEKYKKILATMFDTPTTAIYKTEQLKRDVQNQLDTFLKTAGQAGYKTGELDKEQTVQSNGQTYIVGQVYNDGTANWVVDAQGHWTQQ